MQRKSTSVRQTLSSWIIPTRTQFSVFVGQYGHKRITQTELNCNQTAPSWNITHLCSSHSHSKTKHTSGSVNRAGTRLKTPQKHSAMHVIFQLTESERHTWTLWLNKEVLPWAAHLQNTYRKSHFSTFSTHIKHVAKTNHKEISLKSQYFLQFSEVQLTTPASQMFLLSKRPL